MEDINILTNGIIRCAIKVHQSLGPGLLASSYQKCLYYELVQAGFQVELEKPIPLVYKDVTLECGYRIDLLVEGQIVVEVKSIEAFVDIHLAEVLTYLRLSHNRFGLLFNFNVSVMKDGIKRIVNGF